MKKLNVLFLCSGNSCRSQMAESIMKKLAGDKFNVYSAGSRPDLDKYKETKGVNPTALDLLEKNRFPTENLYSKNWNNFKDHADEFDFVFTLCDKTKSEVDKGECPVFPGQPLSAYWGVEDPSAVTGTIDEIRAAFLSAFSIIQKRISLFVSLPIENLEKIALKQKIIDIGKVQD